MIENGELWIGISYSKEVAAVVTMLAGKGYITGQSISVNRGMYFT